MISLFRRPYLLPACFLTLALVIGLGQRLCPAAETPPVAAKIIDEQKKILRLKKSIEDQKSKMQSSKTQENSLLAELDRLNGHIQKGNDKLSQINKEIAGHELLMATKQDEVARAKEAKDQASIHLKKRLNSFYRRGEVAVLDVLFSTSELPDLLAFREYFDALLKRDHELLREYREQMEALEKARIELHREKQVLIEAINKVKEQEKQLTNTRKERMQMLEKVKTEKNLYQKALEELEGAAGKLVSTLEKLKTEAAEASRKDVRPSTPQKSRPGNTGFAKQKGRLNPPATGTVTTMFGKSVQKKFGISTFANGIDIKTAPGTEITAIYDGTVIYAKFLRGYGNLLIIDHGQQYLSLVSRAARFYKEEGDTVAKGEVVGIMSDQEGLLGDGLHFEIRHGTKPEDPLLWVNNARLTIKSSKRSPR